MKIFLIVFYLYTSTVIGFCFILKGNTWRDTVKRQLGTCNYHIHPNTTFAYRTINNDNTSVCNLVCNSLGLNYGSKDIDMKTNNFEIFKDYNIGYRSNNKRKISNSIKIAKESSDKLTNTLKVKFDKEKVNKSNNNNDDIINKTEISYEVYDPYSDVDHTIYNEIRNSILPILVNVIENNNKSYEYDNHRPSPDKTPNTYEDNVNTSMDRMDIDENITEDNSADKNRHVSNKINETEDYKPSSNTEQNSYEVYETDTEGAETNYNKLYDFVPIDRTTLTRGHGYAIFGKRYAIYVPVETNAQQYAEVNKDSLAAQNSNNIENITEIF